jgi:hypothetical protein
MTVQPIETLYPASLTPREDATEAERAELLHQMRQRGYGWAEITEHLGYANVEAARLTYRSMVQRAAQELSMATKKEMLAAEVNRLDQLMAIAWVNAEAGDLKGVDTCVRIIQVRAKLLGLDEIENVRLGNTVIITDQDMVKQLEEAKAMLEEHHG